MKRNSFLPHTTISLALALTLAAGAGLFKLARVNTPHTHGEDAQARTAQAPPSVEAERAQVSEAYWQTPLYFEANRGQAQRQFKFLSRGHDYTLLLSPSEVVLALRDEARLKSATLRIKTPGANRSPRVEGEDELPGRVNYLRGSSPEHWQTNVETYASVVYREVYPGIDTVYYGNRRQLEYDFRVAPGADPNAIRLRFEGAQALRLDERGDLLISTEAGEVRQHKPFTYQEVGGERREVASRYVVNDNEVKIEVGAYDAAQMLVIDPVLSYSTYLGSGGSDAVTDIAVDADGNAYVTGSMFGVFPTTEGALDRTNAGEDIFVTKLAPTGALVYSTYISSSSGNNQARSIAVDGSGNAHVTGRVVANVIFPTAGAYDTTYNNAGDAFVLKLNAAGSALLYSTFLGTASDDTGTAVAVDPSGDIYVAGHTKANNFPVVGGFQATYGGSSSNGAGDAFLARIHPAASGAADLVYSTYLGGTLDERALGLAADAAGHAYVVGVTNSAGFPTTADAFDTSINGSTTNDGFVTKINTNTSGASSLVYSTFLGGNSTDEINAVALDDAAVPNVYVAGATSSTAATFPTTAGAFQTNINGNGEAFFTRLNPANAGAAGLLYSTFIGGGSIDEAHGIARDAAGNVYVSGRTSSSNFPVSPDAHQPAQVGNSADAFVFKLNPAGAGASDRLYATYFGGGNTENNVTVGVDSQSNIYIAGTTNSNNLPAQNAAQSAFQGGLNDGFVVKLAATAANTFTLSGRVTNNSNAGAGFANVVVNLSGSATGIRTTDAQGYYSFTGLPAGGDYIITPSRVNYTFNPSFHNLNGLNADQSNVDFAATVNTYTISGRITQQGGPQNGQPLSGANVTLYLNNSAGAILQTVQTNSNGDYSFDPQVAERTYYVQPSMPQGATQAYAFANASGSNSTVTNLSANTTVNHTATPLYSVAGRVTDGSGNGIAGVSVSRQFIESVQTNSNGEYRFTGVRAGDTRKIIPTRTGYNFTPVDRTYTNIAADISNFDFTGATQTVTISGHITSTTSQPAGQPLQGVTVKLTGGTTAQTVTNASGDYSFTVGVNASYTVQPELSDYTFAPWNKSFSNITSNQTADFTGAQLFDIRITVRDASEQPISGATVSLSGGGTLTTNAQGVADFPNRSGGTSYTVGVSKSGYVFNPASQTFTLTGDRLDLVSTGTPQTYSISGAVTQTDGLTPIANLTVNLHTSGGGTLLGTTTTAADGTYNFSNLAHGSNFRVSLPAQAGHTFAPAQRDFSNLQANQTNQNFTGTATNYTISGNVADAGSNSINGVTLTLVGTNTTLTSAQTTTDTSGNYSFSVPAGGNYSVTPAKQDYAFNPASRTFNVITSNQTNQNFTGTLSYTIGGIVSQVGGGGPLSGVTVTLSGAQAGTRTTDANGQYSFTGLTPGATYTVTPSLADHTFNPPSRTFGTIAGSQTANFEGFSTQATDLQIIKTASGQSVPAGSEVTYTLAVINHGPHAAANLTVTDNLPASLTFVSCAASTGGTCVGGNASGNNRTITFTSLAPNATAVVTLVARVKDDIAEGTTVNNTAQVSAANSDTNPGNNSSSVQITVNPEPSFDEDGKQSADFFGDNDAVRAVAVQSDGKVIVAGLATSGGNRDFALRRFNEDGSPDTSFGTNGQVTTDFSGGDDRVLALTLQPDGRVVAAGQTSAANSDFALARYNTDGSLDSSFGSGGRATTDFSGGNDAAHSVALQSDGRIVVAGGTDNGGEDFAFARYNSDGQLDSSFDGDGRLTVDISSAADEAHAVVVQTDGKIVAAGFASDASGNKDFALVRRNADGSPDSSFDADGHVTTDFSSDGDEALALALQPDGKLVAAGAAQGAASGNKDFALARYNTDGSLDGDFSSDGKQTTDFEPSADYAQSVAIQKDGKIVLAGFSRVGNSNYDFALARYLQNGQLDAGFDSDGKQTVVFSQLDDRAYGVALQKNGRIVAAGYTTLSDGTRDFAVARLRQNGQLDADVDPDSTANLALSVAQPAATQFIGSQFVYTLAVTNNGPADAAGVTLTDMLPAGAQFVSANTTQGTLQTPAPGSSGGTVTANLGSLLRGATATVNIQVTANAAGLLINTASVNGVETDPNTSNNSATTHTKVFKVASLKLTPSTGTVKGGCEALTGTVTLSGGAAPAGGIAVTIESTNPAATAPATVTIPKGATSATFPITTAQVNSNQTGSITARLGTSSAKRGLTVTPGCP